MTADTRRRPSPETAEQALDDTSGEPPDQTLDRPPDPGRDDDGATGSTATGRRLRRFSALALLVAGVEYLVVELVAASAWATPTYDWAHNLVPDLGDTGIGLNHQGRFVSSPLHALFNGALTAQGLLFAAAILLLAQLAVGRLRAILLTLAVAQAVGLVATSLLPQYPGMSTTALVVNLSVAGAAMVASNLLVIVAGSRWRSLGLPRWLGVAGVILGGVALLVGGTLTVVPVVPQGIVERLSIDPFILWQILAGATMLLAAKRHPWNVGASGVWKRPVPDADPRARVASTP